MEAADGYLRVHGPLGNAELVVGAEPGQAKWLAVWSTPFFPLLWGSTKSFTWGLDGQFKPLWCDELRVLDGHFDMLARVPAGSGWVEKPRYPASLTNRDAPGLAPIWSYYDVAHLCQAAGMTFIRGATPHPRWFVADPSAAYLRPPVGGRPVWTADGVLRAPRR